MSVSDNKRIAKNTMMLYFRMILLLFVSLYTSRIVLNTLGIDDFGLNNVVGGVIAFISVISSSMSAATSRFLTYELGRKDYSQLNRVFNCTIVMHIGMALMVLVILETVGLWFVMHKLVIPENRMSAALWAYHFSIFGTMVTLFQVPFNALIIAHEKMNIYAYVSLVSVILKLAAVFLLKIGNFDKLKLYSVLIFLVTVITALVYLVYCRKKFPETAVSFIWDKQLYKKLLSFSFLDLYTSITGMGAVQGLNIMLNMFFGVSVNAARAIAMNVKASVSNFGDNFMVAAKPQIVKLYADNKIEQMMKLVFSSSKYSVFLTYVIALPVLIETPFILKIWLKTVPDYTVLFCRLLLIDNLINSYRIPIVTSFHAVGKIKMRNLICGTLYLLIIAGSYICLKIGYPPGIVFIITIIDSVLVQTAELLILKIIIKFSVKDYIIRVILPVLLVICISAVLPYLLSITLSTGIIRFLVVGFTSVVATLGSIYFIGIDTETRKIIIQKVCSILIKMKLRRRKLTE